MEDQNDILDAFFPEEKEDPKKDFRKGISYTCMYYLAGAILTALSWFIIGHPYPHAPGPHHLVIFVTFTGGFVWTLGAVVKYLAGHRTWRLKGIIVANMVAVLSFVLIMYVILHEEGGG